MISGRLRFETSHATEFVDVTKLVREEVRKSGLRTGRVHLQSLHTTVGLAINENEPLLLRDFQKLLERLAPGDAGYEHDDFARRYQISVDEPVNGHAHCRQLLLTGFATLLVEDGDPPGGPSRAGSLADDNGHALAAHRTSGCMMTRVGSRWPLASRTATIAHAIKSVARHRVARCQRLWIAAVP